MKQTIIDTLESYRLNLIEGEYFSSASANIMAEQLESALLNKFEMKRRPEVLYADSIEEILIQNGIIIQG